jgi:hypothetical protein
MCSFQKIFCHLGVINTVVYSAHFAATMKYVILQTVTVNEVRHVRIGHMQYSSLAIAVWEEKLFLMCLTFWTYCICQGVFRRQINC